MSDSIENLSAIRYCVQRELAKVQDVQKLVDVLNLLGVKLKQIDRHIDLFLQAKPKRRLVLEMDAIDEHWLAVAIAAYERRGPVRSSGSEMNGAAIVGMAMEWHGAMLRGAIE